MGRWLFIIACILLFVAGGYFLLQREGVSSCQEYGGEWDYARWKCDS